MNELETYYPRFSQIKTNAQINFKLKWTIKLYGANSFSTFIPKNACTSLRYSAAIKNNVLQINPNNLDWVHNNNPSFNINIEEAITSSYTFVFLRCPISRIISTFLDKFLSKDREAWIFRDFVGRSVDLDDLTFQKFVQLISEKPRLAELDAHWTPQNKFLLIKQYSNYFCVEELDKAKEILKNRINMDLLDTRSISRHTTNHFIKKKIENAFNIPAYELYKIKKEEGFVPNNASMINQELLKALEKIYSDDIEIYKEKFSSKNLFHI